MWKEQSRGKVPVGDLCDRGCAWVVCPHLWPHPTIHSVYRSLSFLWMYSPTPLALLVFMLSQLLRMLFLTFCLWKLSSSVISLCVSPLELILVQLGLLSLMYVSFFHTTLCFLKVGLFFYLALYILPLLGPSNKRNGLYIFIAINGMELSMKKRCHSSKTILRVEV